MHELGLCDALLRMIRKILADEEDVTRVSRVTLEVGELSGVLPRYMYDCWEAVIDGT
jgi:hydrogenase nickel incorporation protein HypA/HybF